MRQARAVACLLAATAVLAGATTAVAADQAQGSSPPASSDHPTPSSLEVFALVGPTLAQGGPANNAATTSFRRVGIYSELGVAFRSNYFIDPFISAGYGALASADTKLSDGEWGAGGTLHQNLGIWFISPGVTTDIWRLRLRLGLGLAVVKQNDTFHSEKNTGTQLPFAAQIGLGFNCYETRRFRLDVDARYVKAAGADVSFGLLGITARGDLITFGGGS
jgi:Lipid A 3-O-deacylase (PagL)